MTRQLHHLPALEAPATENMAHDLLLLHAYPDPEAIRFRHYTWANPCHTFGYTQEWNFIQSQTSDITIRRATAGGLVSHHHDWTWALVIPANHPCSRQKASLAYQQLHQAINQQLRKQNVPATLIPCPRQNCGDTNPPIPSSPRTGICFQAPEIYDVIRENNGAKIAGAAQKRNRYGLLIQGSIDRKAAHELKDWDRFENDLVQELASLLEATALPAEFPKWDPLTWEATHRKFESAQWNQRR